MYMGKWDGLGRRAGGLYNKRGLPPLRSLAMRMTKRGYKLKGQERIRESLFIYLFF